MSIWRSGHKTHKDVEEHPDVFADFQKPYTKIDITSKLLLIQAIDSGQCKSDIAREYGVHPQTVAHIYKQKESIIKKHTHKYNLLKQVSGLNLEQNLLFWFEQQIQIGNNVVEDQLHLKAEEILKPLDEEFTCISDWLFNFRMRHNISKYTPDNIYTGKHKEEWNKFLKSSEVKDIYLGGVCALSHNLDLTNYLNGQDTDTYVTLLFTVHTLGTDRREVAVVGKELLESEAHIRSLPVHYYYTVNSQINYPVIINYLTKWDKELLSRGKSITLVLDIPENIINNLHFRNIRIISSVQLNYVKTILEKIVECFKYHYRRLQISRSLTYGKDNSKFLDYLHMIGSAWYNITHKFIQSLSITPEEGSLYFHLGDECENNHSISHWCKIYNVPLNPEHCSNLLDKFIYCDNELPCIYCDNLDERMQAVEVISQKPCQSTSSMEAYQAMKRLVCYLQGESAGGSIMKYAKYLENHIEYGALLQMHQIIASTNDSM